METDKTEVKSLGLHQFDGRCLSLAGTSSAAVAKFTTLKRSLEEEPWEQFFGEQRITEHDSKSTDCHLICSDGFVPAHSLVLQVVSPFFDAIFAGQCPCLKPRPITMEDYKVADVRKLVELIYTGEVILKSEKQAEAIKEMIKSFNILSPVPLECAREVIKPSRGRPILKEDTDALFIPFNKSKTVKENLEMIRKPILSIARADPAKIKASATTSRIVNHAATNHVNVRIPAKVVVAPATPAARVEPAKPKPTNQKSDSESEDDDEKAINASREWFLQEAKRCQYCNVTCKTAAAASTCLTSHNRLRCYFCFKVVRSTEKLFQHFDVKHKKAGRENCLLCPLCETIVPFRSASCHVISLHLSDTKNPASSSTNVNRGNSGNTGRAGAGGQVGRPPSSSANANGNSMPAPAPPSQGIKTIERTKTKRSAGAGKDTEAENDGGAGAGKPKKKKYALPDLNTSLKMQSICGRIRVFEIGKPRRMDAGRTKT